uniref:Heat stress transcription factor n=1 Tax=Agave sisalana TaxID=442491 RepID=A0A5J6SDI4_9ASPA|nr:heat stress transcription factor [Agave sisalana]
MKDKKKKKKEKGTKFESLSKSGTEEGKGSGNGDKKRKGTISNEGETEKKKRTKYDNKDGKDKKVTKDKKKKNVDGSKTGQPKKKLKSKRVSFSGDVEVFPPSDDSDCEVEYDEGNLVRGKRFSEEEDQLIRDAVENYIQTNQLGEDGLKMVLKCSKYPQVKDCWKEIGLALPWRPYLAVYSRAHTIFERSEKRGFSKEEKEIIKKFHAEHGPQWKELSEVLGKQRIHIKDAWRRVRLPNEKKGHWSQDEYQSLFDLVNLDLRIKAFEKKKSDNVMKREDISWEAISDKITTRTMSSCCHKWYDQLRSPLVAQGVWADSDDYRLLDSLQKQDGCNVEEVDWDSLVEGRCGEVCRKRWGEMVRHIGGHRERTFIEQVDVLIKRYCGDMLEYRFRREEEEEEEEEG